ncbi:MAG: hypothetical protein V2A34_13310 [Lentisphaerota bacterium]
MIRRRDPRAASRSKVAIYTTIIIICAPVFIFLQSVWLSQNQDIFQKSIIQLQIRRIPCDYCGEVGTVRDPNHPDRPTMICPVCYGIGSHTIRKFDKHDTLCPLCGGAGRVGDAPSGYAQECPRCDGRGVIRVEEDLFGQKPGN